MFHVASRPFGGSIVGVLPLLDNVFSTGLIVIWPALLLLCPLELDFLNLPLSRSLRNLMANRGPNGRWAHTMHPCSHCCPGAKCSPMGYKPAPKSHLRNHQRRRGCHRLCSEACPAWEHLEKEQAVPSVKFSKIKLLWVLDPQELEMTQQDAEASINYLPVQESTEILDPFLNNSLFTNYIYLLKKHHEYDDKDGMHIVLIGQNVSYS